MIREGLWEFVTSGWVTDVVGLIGDIVRVIPYTLLFFFGFLIVQGLMACKDKTEV